MLLRRVAPAALAISALTACEPGVGYDASHAAPTNYAVYDLAASPPDIPQPNDLALQQAAVIPGAQGELLRLFASQRGFPNDQEVPVTLDLVKITTATGGVQTRSAPKPDLSSFKPCTGPGQNCNVAVIDLATLAFVPDIAVPVATDFAVSGDHGTLSIRRSPRPTAVGASTRTWDPGKHYVAVLRGGPNGITVDSGQPIAADPTLYILEQGKNLTDPANQGLLPGNTPAEKAAVGAQLEPIREFLENGPFQVASTAFPKSEIASITTFPVAPASTDNPTHPVVDSGSGVIPLPFNALLDGSTLPDDPLAPAVGAHVQNLPLTFGPLADGIASLDGFSTTAFVFAPMSSFVVVATGNDPNPASTLTGNIFLYEITDPNSPIFLSGTNSYDDLLPGPLTPAPVRGGGPTIWVAPVVGVQPAAATRPTSTQPLKEAAEYAVIITNGITDTAGKPIGRPTLGNILLFQNPLWANGKSQLAGISDAQAKALERMRAQIANLLSNLGGGAPFTRDQIALAYTFRTQTVTSLSLQLAAAPYDPAKSPSVNFLSANVLTPAAAFAKYRVDTAAPASVAFDNIQEVIEASLPTPNLLSNTSGAFDPNLFAPGATPPVEVIPALIVVPNAPAITTSCPPPADTLKCAPLVVFHHGLSGGRAQMLLGANELAGQGFVVAAIDAPKHGDRSFCSASDQCASGTCQPIGPPGTQGDATPPGVCKDASGNPTGLKKNPVLCASAACIAGGSDGVAVASGNYLLTANLFRFRDTLRQDVLDNSNLILAMARLPGLPATTNPNPVAAELQSKGIVVDPAHVFWEGQSLGGILGTINTAVNPRISEAVLNVPGGTFVDISITSPDFRAVVLPVLHNIPPPVGPIDPGTSAFLQFLQVAKWVFDPAEPVNYAGHLLGDADHPMLPNLLLPGTLQSPKSVLGQMAVCDPTVPNPFNLLLFHVAGLGQGVPNEFEIFQNNTNPVATGFCVIPTPPFDSGAVSHGFLLDHGLPTLGINAVLSQDARNFAAAFLHDPTTVQPPVDSQ